MIETYKLLNVQCFCNSDQLREKFSHIRFKFGLPVSYWYDLRNFTVEMVIGRVQIQT